MSSLKPIKLNDGRSIPAIGFGTWRIGSGETVVTQVDQALSVGFDHIDTAQSYANQSEAGEAISLSGIPRSDVWVTTKFSGYEFGLGIYEACEDSLRKLGLKYVDLYLLHYPEVANGDIPGTWKEMEKLQKAGLAKSIGVSNFGVEDLKELVASAEILPVVNQIELHPYVYAEQSKIIAFQEKYEIVTEAYSSLLSLTKLHGGPVDKPVEEIAARLGVEPEQVLLAWVKAKGAVIVTTSSKKDRLERYLAVGDINLTKDDVAIIDQAGAKQSFQWIWANAGLRAASLRLALPKTPVLKERALQTVYGALLIGGGFVGWKLLCGM